MMAQLPYNIPATSKRERRLSALQSRLPETFAWANSDSGSFEYREAFLKALLMLPEREQRQVIRQLWNLRQYGPRFHSLNTKKYQAGVANSPADCKVSYGSIHLRFTWQQEGNALTVCWLCRRGSQQLMLGQ